MHQGFDYIRLRRIIASVPSLPLEKMDKLAQALYDAGVCVMEVLFNPERPEKWRDTSDAIRLLAKKYKDKIMPGAGIVLTPDQIQMAHYAGAQFVIFPHTDTALIKRAKTLAIATISSALSPTEAIFAHQAGVDAVQVYPAGALGLDFFQSLHRLLPHIPMVATGAVSTPFAQRFISAGATAVGIQDAAIYGCIDADDWDSVTELAGAYISSVESASY